MVELLVMRHAKSDWAAGFADDHERPLAPRGIEAARTMGRFLTASNHVPDLVMTSTAVRALATVEVAAQAGGWTCPIDATADFYGGDQEAVLEHLGRTAVPRVLVAGHEPTWSSLVTWLAGGGRVRMPTAAVACIQFTASSWPAVRPGSGQLRWLVTPKLIEGAVQR